MSLIFLFSLLFLFFIDEVGGGGKGSKIKFYYKLQFNIFFYIYGKKKTTVNKNADVLRKKTDSRLKKNIMQTREKKKTQVRKKPRGYYCRLQTARALTRNE